MNFLNDHLTVRKSTNNIPAELQFVPTLSSTESTETINESQDSLVVDDQELIHSQEIIIDFQDINTSDSQ